LGKFYEGLAEELTLHVRQIAWLTATPMAPTSKKGAVRPAEDDAPSPTRAEAREKAGLSVELPPITAGSHLVGYLWEVGPNMAAGMGAAPVSWTELQAWQDQAGHRLSPWEVRTLRALSAAYVSESHRASKAGCLPPWTSDIEQKEREVVSRHIRNVLRN
jgi:hypothetical protein